MPRSVLHILGSAQPEGTGVAKIVASLARGLDPGDFKVHACFLSGPGPLADRLEGAGVHVLPLTLRPGRHPLDAWRVWQAVRRSRFSIIHQHAGGMLLRRIARRAGGSAIVLHLHGRVREAVSFSPQPIRVRAADMAIASSRAVAQHVLGVTPRVVYAGVPPVDFPERSDRSRPENLTIGVGCRLAPIKGVSTLIRAFAMLHDEFPTLRLEIAGDGPERQALANLITELGLGDRVSLLGWKPELASVLANWDVFALPSLEEGFGIAAVEAMAAGLPVVASAVGGLMEIVQNGKTGRLVPPEDPTALAHSLRDLLQQPARRIEMGRQGQLRARAEFSEARMVREIAELYEEVTGTHSSASRLVGPSPRTASAKN